MEILYDVHLKDGAVRRENLTQIVLRGALWDTSHIDVAIVVGIDHVVILVNDDLLTLLFWTLLHLVLFYLDVEMLNLAVFYISISIAALHSLQLRLFWVVVIILLLNDDTRLTYTFLSNSIWTLKLIIDAAKGRDVVIIIFCFVIHFSILLLSLAL